MKVTILTYYFYYHISFIFIVVKYKRYFTRVVLSSMSDPKSHRNTQRPSKKHVMLLDRLCDVPSTTHAGGERRVVALPDRHRPSSITGGDGDLPLEQIT